MNKMPLLTELERKKKTSPCEVRDERRLLEIIILCFASQLKDSFYSQNLFRYIMITMPKKNYVQMNWKFQSSTSLVWIPIMKYNQIISIFFLTLSTQVQGTLKNVMCLFMFRLERIRKKCSSVGNSYSTNLQGINVF